MTSPSPKTPWGTILLTSMVMAAGSILVYGGVKMWKDKNKEIDTEETELAQLKAQLLLSNPTQAAPSTLAVQGRQPSTITLTDGRFHVLYPSSGNLIH